MGRHRFKHLRTPRRYAGPERARRKLFFVDETGHETFADARYPVFGIGGCAILSSVADIEINEPLRQMTYFSRDNIAISPLAIRERVFCEEDATSKEVRPRQP